MADPVGAGWRGPTTAVLAIPDAEAYEEEQEALLQSLRVIRATGDSLLVWRPVLACLAALDSGIVGDAARVGIVGHAGAGLTSQRLLVKEHRGNRAPERRETGQLHAWDGGLDALRRQAWRALVEASATPDRADHLATARILTPLALGEAPGAEAVRQPSGNWEVVAPGPLNPSLPPIPSALVKRMEACDIALVDPPTAGGMRKALVGALADALPSPVHLLAHQEVARGGLLAAGRIARREPVYFDFLPQLSTIVQDDEGARNFDLIPPDAVVPAGHVYRSREPARLGLSADTTTIEVYLRKQQAEACRLAEVPLAAFAQATNTAVAHVSERVFGRVRGDNDSLRFLTWQFHRCPDAVVEEIVRALERPPGSHTFNCVPGHHVLLSQGAGRTATDPDHQARALVCMMESAWKSQHLACVGFLLSRTDTAPALLSHEQIHQIAAELVRRNGDAVGQPYTARYLYVPIVLLGLVRCRLRDPWTLVAGQDAVADDLLSSTGAVIDDMEHRFPGDQRIGRYRAILEDVCDWLRVEGRNPDILLDLTNLASP